MNSIMEDETDNDMINDIMNSLIAKPTILSNADSKDTCSKIHLFITHYNNLEYLHKCLTSVFDQKLSIPFQVLLIDDCSPDPSTSEVLDGWQKKEPTRLVILRNTERVGKGVNLFRCLDASKCDSEDIICVLDGDDWLTDMYSLQIVIERYQATGCWVTYGSYMPSNGSTYCSAAMNSQHYESEKKGRGFRECGWVFSHLFTAKAFLWLKLPRDINIFNGQQATVTADQVFNIPIAEMAGSDRIQYIKNILVLYYAESLLNDSLCNGSEQVRIDRLNRERPAFKRLEFKV